ncbi:MAG: AmpG protein [Pseudomonadota bacterium]|jgi:PAT family beta-lactamase induction signal transducer AmpG
MNPNRNGQQPAITAPPPRSLLTMTLLLGFASGLPLALSAGTLQAWLTVEGVNLKTLGWLTLLGLPYTYKFLWAPLLDRYRLPVAGNWTGRRRGWLVALLLAMAAVLAAMSFQAPSSDPNSLIWLAALAFGLVILSASFDIVFDAWRAESLTPAQRGLGAAWSVIGYRLAMLTSGGLALMLADLWLGFQGVYLLMAGFAVVFAVIAAIAPEPTQAPAPRSLVLAVVEPFKEFFGRPGALLFLLMIVLYKFGDAFAGSLSTAFLIRGAGFTPAEVGAVNKGMGLLATLVGGLAGGLLLSRISLWQALLVFGVLQGVTNLGFWWLASTTPTLAGMTAVVLLENLAGGMGTAAFVALLMGLCDVRFTATQFALLSALASIGRVVIGPVAGVVASDWGWPEFFLLSTALAIPGVLLLALMRQRFDRFTSPPIPAPD